MTPRVTLTVLDTGYCTARSSLIARGTGWRDVRCRAPAFLISHAQHGSLLFDTGYAPRLQEAFEHWPDRLYHYATPTTLGVPVVAQLAAHGVAVTDIRRVIVSHLHADHVAGLRDFPSARFVVSADALALQQRCHGLDAVRRGIVQQLFPDDFAARADVVREFRGPVLPHLGPTHDLHGDGSVLLVRLPGHARGQIGALVQSVHGTALLCADGAWTSQAYRELRPPHWVTGAMQDDVGALTATLRNIRDYAAACPDVSVLPTHCPETLRWARRP